MENPMEAERKTISSTKNTTRKPIMNKTKPLPLSDRTNLNLIPTSSLRKLCASTFQKPSIPDFILNAKPNTKSKPYEPFSKINNKADDGIHSSNSNTSIGSSNLSSNLGALINPSNRSTITQPKLFTPTPIRGKADDEIFEPLIGYSRRRTSEKLKSIENNDVVPFSLRSIEQRTDKGKASVVPFGCSPLQKTDAKGKEIALPLENTKDKSKAGDMTLGFNYLEKARDRGKAVVETSSPQKVKGKRKVVSLDFSCPPLPRTTRKIRNEPGKAEVIEISKSRTDPHAKQQKKRRRAPREHKGDFALPRQFIDEQRAYFKEIDEFELLEEEVSYDEFKKEDEAEHLGQQGRAP